MAQLDARELMYGLGAIDLVNVRSVDLNNPQDYAKLPKPSVMDSKYLPYVIGGVVIIGLGTVLIVKRKKRRGRK